MEKKPFCNCARNLDWSIAYIFAFWILELTFRLVMFIRWDFFQLTGNDGNDEYLYIIYLNISDWFAYPELLLHLKGCKKKDNQIKYINRYNKKAKIKYYIFIVFAFLDLLAKSIYFISYKTIGNIGTESEKLAKDGIIFLWYSISYYFLYEI